MLPAQSYSKISFAFITQASLLLCVGYTPMCHYTCSDACQQGYSNKAYYVKVVLLTTAIDEEFLELKHAGGLITSNPLFPGQFSRTVSNFSDLSVYSLDTVFLLAFPFSVQCLINTFTLIVRQLSP